MLLMPADWDPTSPFCCPSNLQSIRGTCNPDAQGALAIDKNNYYDLYRCNNNNNSSTGQGQWEKAIDEAYYSTPRITNWHPTPNQTFSWGAWGNSSACKSSDSTWNPPYVRQLFRLGCLSNVKSSGNDTINLDNCTGFPPGPSVPRGCYGSFVNWLHGVNGWIATYNDVEEAVKTGKLSPPDTFAVVAAPPASTGKNTAYGSYVFYADGKSEPDPNDNKFNDIPDFHTQNVESTSACYVWVPDSLYNEMHPKTGTNPYPYIVNQATKPQPYNPTI